MILEAVYHLLSNDTDVKTAVDSHIHYEQRPQGQSGAAIILQRGTLTSDTVFGGASTYYTGIFRVNILAPQFLQCSDIAQKVNNVLHGYSGGVVLPLLKVCRIGFISLDGQADIPNEAVEGGDVPLIYGIAADYRFGYRQGFVEIAPV